jgi:hypothetical protein
VPGGGGAATGNLKRQRPNAKVGGRRRGRGRVG